MSNTYQTYQITIPQYKLMHLGIILISICALCTAGIAEYIFHIQPCPLCIYERLPYLVLIKLSLTEFYSTKNASYNKYNMLLIIITLLVAIGLSMYHAAVELNLFPMSALCNQVINIPDYLSEANVEKLLYEGAPVLCSKAGWKLFGYSMTIWNVLTNLGILIITTIFWIKGKQYA